MPAATNTATRPGALDLYVGLTIAIGALAIGSSLHTLSTSAYPADWMLLAGLGLVAGACVVKVPGLNALISVSDTFFIASAIMFGPGPAILALAIDSAALAWRRGYGPQRLLFNAAAPAASLWIGTQTFFLIIGAPPPLAAGPLSISGIIPALLALSVVYFGLNSGLTAGAIALESQQSFLAVWRRLGVLSVSYLAAGSAAFCLVVVTRSAGIAAAVMVVPLVLVFHFTLKSFLGRLEDAQRHVETVDRLYLSTIETLAAAIEAKDGVTHDHIRRVQTHAVALARVLGVKDDSTIKAIQAAALLHDTGKLGVPEHILNKPGKLTPVEFEQMKLHVDVGADILSAIDFPYPVVPIVRAHHENWDGSGYPRGITGVDIPIGARILSVVDCFDALTSDRPYRTAMNQQDAFAVLMARRGTMYDPMVVDTFMRVHKEIVTPVRHAPAASAGALQQIGRAAAPQPPAASTLATVRGDVPEDVLAIFSLSKLLSGDVTLADASALVGMHLRRLFPQTTCVLYLADARSGGLVIGYVSGTGAENLHGFTIPIGQRLSGWVAAHRQTMVNSDPALDLFDRNLTFAAALSTPLVHGDRVVGVLTSYSTIARGFADSDGQLVQMMAPHLAGIVAAAIDAGARRGQPFFDGTGAREAVGERRDLRMVPRRS